MECIPLSRTNLLQLLSLDVAVRRSEAQAKVFYCQEPQNLVFILVDVPSFRTCAQGLLQDRSVLLKMSLSLSSVFIATRLRLV